VSRCRSNVTHVTTTSAQEIPSLTVIAQASTISCLAHQECSVSTVRLVRWADVGCPRRNSFTITSAYIPYSACACTDSSIICHPSPSRRPSTQSLSIYFLATYTDTSSNLNDDDIVSTSPEIRSFMERCTVAWPGALGPLVPFSCASYVCTSLPHTSNQKLFRLHLIYSPCLFQRGDSALRSLSYHGRDRDVLCERDLKVGRFALFCAAMLRMLLPKTIS
jgi:hypothetical protein